MFKNRHILEVRMGDTDDTTIYHNTKYSRYWYRRGHDTDDIDDTDGTT